MKRFPVIHPLLFAALPLLFLFAHNTQSLYVNPTELALPLALAVGTAFLVWLGLRFAFRSGAKAGLVVTLTLFLFFVWGPVADGLYARFSWFRTWQLGALFIVILAAGCFLVARSRREFRMLTVFLDLTAAALCALNVALSLPALLRPGPSPGPAAAATPAPGHGLPDVYYIIPDGHGRSDILADIYDYDNSAFIAQLRARGFYVADQARANYSQTYLSLGSALNMTYVDSLADALGRGSDDRGPLVRWLLGNRVMRELRSRGYCIVSFLSGYSGTDFKDTDVRLAQWWMPSEFRRLAISLTPVGALLAALFRKSLHELHRERIEYILDQLPTAARGHEPAFVFAHILAPHPPFVFGPGGERLEVDRPFFTIMDGSANHHGEPDSIAQYVAGYRGQVQFIERQLLGTIDGILRQSERPPVIIMHADHGPGSRSFRDDPCWTYFPERQAILYAVLMPARDYSGWHDSITPVNTFRLVFDRLFNDTLTVLPDRSYFATWDRPYTYYDVDSWRAPAGETPK